MRPNRSETPRSGRRNARLAARAGLVVELDLLLAHLVGHGLLLGARLRAEADALLGHDLLLHDRALLVEHDLVLLLGDRRTVGGRAGVGLGDRLALERELL